jgi:ubiquinone/menaquinone biosynthesis C-methylase UbiE
MTEYFKADKLYGDDFSFEQIKQWYNEETEGYADLGSKNKISYSYGYHIMNQIHGYNKINKINFENVLGFGSAWGYEFEPIIKKIKNLTIIEPSDNLVNNRIGNLNPKYVKPNIDGSLPFDDNSFDLITCFGTLHHIPNVSFVISELVRVLKTNGYLLLREPIISMGDWREKRRGLTKNERGIPISFFDTELGRYSIEIVSKEYCFTVTSLIQRAIGFFFKKPIYSYKTYVVLDKYISSFLKKNIRYHATRKINKIGPQSIFYVIKKL